MPETLSRIIVAIELSIALLVSLPFLIMFIGGTLGPMFDEVTTNNLSMLGVSVVVLLCLACGLRMAFVFLRYGNDALHAVSGILWAICGAASLSSIVCTVAILGDFVEGSLFAIAFMFGIAFVPIFVHLVLERCLREL